MLNKFLLNASERLRKVRIVLVLIIIMVIPASAAAQQDREVNFVYGLAFYDGFVYGNALVPNQSEEMFLIADVNNVIAPRNTLVYYWPLTNHYMADWTSMNELVEGELEIIKNNILVTTIELQKYLVQYDSSDPVDTLELYVGDKADSAYNHFKELQDQYRLDLRAYYDEMQVYRDTVNELLASEAAENATLTEDDFPERPKEIAGFTLHSQTVAEGFILSLPEGRYKIQMRLPDGRIQPYSEKTLVVFNKNQDGSSYNVVPESRWTRPERSKDKNSVIYTLSGSTIYLAPFRQSKYNEYYYEHMLDPQNQSSRKDRNEWVAFEPLAGVSLEQYADGKFIGNLPLEGYSVEQLPGSARGYEVTIFDPDQGGSPSFQGYKITLDEGRNRFEIQMVDESGNQVEGSQRLVRVLYTDHAWLMYILSLLPVIVGLGVITDRNRRIRRIKVKDEQGLLDL